MKLPRFIDLRALASELEVSPNYKNLGAAIRTALVAQSCLADLKQSTECCKSLRAVLLSPRKRNTLERGAIESSLLANAVMLYARATATPANRGERGSIQINAKLTPTQQIDHQILIEIRNRALAHVYTAEPIAGELWHEQLMFATEVDGLGWRAGGASRRVQFDRPTLERLERQLLVAHEIIRAKAQRRIDAVTNMLSEQPLPQTDFEAHRFDPVQQFGSMAAVEQVLDGLISGEASTLTSR